MGYDYLIRLSVGEVELADEQLLEIRTAYQSILKEDRDGWFPIFGKVRHTGSRGYGCGNSDKLKEYIVKLTSLFPQITFHVYYFYDDMTCLEVYSVNNKDVKLIFSKYLKEIETGVGKVWTLFNKDCYVNGEILDD